MKTYTYPVAVLGLAAFAFGQGNSTQEPPIVGVTWVRGAEPSSSRTAAVGNAARRSPDMTYHGGKIMPTAVTQAIFWGPS